MSTIYIITGQTATGKTNYALELAQKVNGELINCDSRQIYRHLDIITGKDLNLTDRKFHLHAKIGDFKLGYYQTIPTTINQHFSTKIWLYDIVDPKFPFSTFDYSTCAIKTLEDILANKKTPIIVGGTYFYIKQLIYGSITHAVNPNWAERKKLENKTVNELQELLKKANKEQFEKLNNSEKHNPHRLIRWLEIAQTPDNEPSKLKQNTIASEFPKLAIKIAAITLPSKELLTKRITARVEDRINNGAITEVKQLLTKGYKSTDPGLKTIGYAQIIKYLEKTIPKQEMVQEWITRELQYAKRQYTFMKKDPQIEWLTF